MPRSGKGTEGVPCQRVVNRLSVGGFIHRLAKSHWHAIGMSLNIPTVEPVKPKLHQPFGKNQNSYQTNAPFRIHTNYKLEPDL